MTTVLSRESFSRLRDALAALGYVFEVRPRQEFLARGDGVVVNLYSSGAVVISGRPEDRERILALISELGGTTRAVSAQSLPPIDVRGNRVGIDEVGKGDYFGPLVACAAFVTSGQVDQLKAIGVRDSKTLSDMTISNIAVKVRRILAKEQVGLVVIPPVRYNMLYERMGNVNRVLGWAHATALEDALKFREPCEVAIADQFGDESYIEEALKRRGRQVRLIQTPKAEREVSVATASVLARDALLRTRLAMREEYGAEFPLGASHVEDFARTLVSRLGKGALVATAKVHFKTTERVLGPRADLGAQVRQIASQSKVESPIGPIRVETDRLEAYSILDAFEPELREFIRDRLQDLYGAEWWARGVPQQIREKAERKQRQEAEKGRPADPIDCLDFSHYELIICGDNWDPVFKAVFQDKNAFLARLRPVQEIRNPIAHTRSLTRSDRSTLVGSVEWLRTRIQESRDRSRSQPHESAVGDSH